MIKKTTIYTIALILCMSLCACGLIQRAEELYDERTPIDSIKPPVYPEADGEVVVCLDSGHGFKDIGCSSDLMEGTEAEVNLDVTLRLKAALEKRGARVILTHDGETFPSASEIIDLCEKKGIEYKEEEIVENEVFSAYERAMYVSAIAEDEGIDFFISLHVNSIVDHPEIDHFEVDYHKGNPYGRALRLFCKDLASRLEGETRIFADEYENAFIVTKPDTHPSVLFEMGFATNEANAENLNSPQWREEMANTLCDAILDWIYTFEQ